MRRVLALTAVFLALPATALAAHPVKGDWFNDSYKRGGYMQTTPHTVETLWLFCRNPVDQHPNHPEYREGRWVIPIALHVNREGRFSFKGKAHRYGPEGEPAGRWKVKLSGHFVSSREVRIKRKLGGCDSATITIHLQRAT